MAACGHCAQGLAPGHLAADRRIDPFETCKHEKVAAADVEDQHSTPSLKGP